MAKRQFTPICPKCGSAATTNLKRGTLCRRCAFTAPRHKFTQLEDRITDAVENPRGRFLPDRTIKLHDED